jgi:hypothetical protein
MGTDFLKRAEALRAEAWDAVQSSPAYAAFKAMDDAVLAIGGRSLMARDADRVNPEIREEMRRRAEFIAMPARRISQANAAAIVLRKTGKPLQAAELMDGARSVGAAIGGDKPLVSFTSSLSKDPRFYAFRKDGSYFWWFVGEAPPLAFQNEAEPDGFQGLLGSASSPNQEGGEGHGPPTT